MLADRMRTSGCDVSGGGADGPVLGRGWSSAAAGAPPPAYHRPPPNLTLSRLASSSSRSMEAPRCVRAASTRGRRAARVSATLVGPDPRWSLTPSLPTTSGSFLRDSRHGKDVEEFAMERCIQMHQRYPQGLPLPKLRWGPAQLDDAYARCGSVTSEYAKTFYLGTQLMQPKQARAIWAVYVWCRRTDELVDGPNASRITPKVRGRAARKGHAANHSRLARTGGGAHARRPSTGRPLPWPALLPPACARPTVCTTTAHHHARCRPHTMPPPAPHHTPHPRMHPTSHHTTLNMHTPPTHPGHHHAQALDRWEERLEALFEGRPYDVLDAALTDTISQFPLDIQPFRDMIEGMRMDLFKARYETYDELYEYCYRVAGAVGLMSMPVMGIDPIYKVRRGRGLGRRLGAE
jgi:hypothetical protein